MASPFSWPALVPCGLRPPAPVNLGVRPTKMKRFIIFLLMALVGCSPKERTVGEDPVKRQRECTAQKDDLIIYRTAAGFQLSRPSWTYNSAHEDQFNKDCELTYLKLHFALVEGELIPIPHPGISNPHAPELPKSFDELTLMFTFQDPSTDGPGTPEHHCIASKNLYRLPQAGVQMCGDIASPNITTLPFYPRFEFIDSRDGNPSMQCSHGEIQGRTITDVQKLSTKYSCRGYWTWRPGAHSMFDLGHGEVLKKFKPAIEAAQSTLNSWVIQN
jgi:hypothetical protein